ncbi:MAG TPA: methyltransferase domain-containing protein [Solirubrobacteraceae bacterium]|jgi:SAM-dependent methyltransferase
MAATPDPDEQRAELIDRWEFASSGWGKRAQRMREAGMAVSTWLIEQLSLQPGQRLLELAAGPGDTGFLAAELIAPGGTLITSDATEGMLAVARERAQQFDVKNVEFKQLQIEWIDLPTASVDAIVCRWGYMLTVDPAAGMSDARRVLKPGGRFAIAVWDRAPENPWATIPTEAFVQGGYLDPPERGGVGMFALADPDVLQQMLEDAGFVEVVIDSVEVIREYDAFEDYWGETLDLSPTHSRTLEPLSDEQRADVERRVRELTATYTDAGGALVLPGRSLVASASA